MRRREITNIALELLQDKLRETKVLLAAERCHRTDIEDSYSKAVEEIQSIRAALTRLSNDGNRQQEQYMRKLREIEAVIRLNNPNALDTLDTVMGIVRQAIENKEVSF